MKIDSWFLCAALTFVAAHSHAADTPAGTEQVESLTLTVANTERTYLLFTPAGLPPNSPLVIAFHPSDSSGRRMRVIGGAALERIARKRGFAIAYPDGIGWHFDDCRRAAPYSAKTQKIDDVGFARAIVKQIAGRYKIDTARVYAVGYSNGGQMALRLALETPDLVAGVVAISANLPAPDNNDCELKNGHPVSVVLIEGTHDDLNPYSGGNVSLRGKGDRGMVMSALASAQWFASRYGVAERPNPPPPLAVHGLAAKWRDWGNDHVMVRLITIDGGGHTIPQADYVFPGFILGPTFRSDTPLESAFDAILEDR